MPGGALEGARAARFRFSSTGGLAVTGAADDGEVEDYLFEVGSSEIPIPEISENLADQVARIVRSIRQLDLKKSPSVSETLDWARTLMLLNIETIDEQIAKETLNILLKYQTDIAKAAKELSVDD